MINQGSYKILYIKIGGNFVPIGCLTENSFSETAGTIDTTTRENTDGWGSVQPTDQGYSIPFSGVSTLSDLGGTIASYDALQGLKRSRSQVEWQIKSDQGGNTETGFGYITDLSNSAAVGAEVTFSGTILGSGLPVTIPGVQAAAPANFRNEDPAPTYCLVLWDKSVTGVMISYRVYNGGVFFREFVGDVAQGTLTGLAASTLYAQMTVRAWDGVEESPDSNEISFTTAAGTNIIVIDNLDSISAVDALSANMGRELNVTKLDDVIQGTNVTIDKTDPLNPVISATATPTVIVDNLTSTAADQALSANMGRQLNVTKLNDVFAGANVAVDKTDPLAPIISSLPQTSAGSIRRVWFTGDELNLSTLFYETSTDKGLIATRQQQVTNGDDQTTFFDVDFIGHAAEGDENLVGGDYTGHLDVEINSNAGNQRYDIELYVADAQGVPFDSGVPGELIGDLGFQTLARATTGIFDIEDGNPTSIVYAFTLAATLVVPLGTRVRYHISATKVGTDGADVVMSLYSGSNYLSYLDAPIEVDTAGVVNYNENITGATQDDVNVNVEANKIPLEGGETWRMTGQIYGGETINDTLPDTRKRETVMQMGGFFIYQGVEVAVGTDIYQYNEGLGELSLNNNEGYLCMAMGAQALLNNKGNNVNGLGAVSGANNIGQGCTFIGSNSGENNQGDNVVVIGNTSGGGNRGNDVTGVGYGVLSANVGDRNVAVGHSALNASSGSNNSALGDNAGTLPTASDPMTFSNTTSLGANSLPIKDNQVMLGDASIVSVRTGNDDYVASDDNDLVPKRQTAISTVSGEMTGATKADNQVIISEANYGDGTGHITGTLYFLT